MYKLIIALLLLCNVASAEIKIEGPDSAEPCEPVVFTVTGATEPQWQIEPELNNGKMTYILHQDGSVTFCTYPGRYVLFAAGKSEDGKFLTTKHIFTVSGTPGPGPGPGPAPAPLSKIASLIKENLSVTDKGSEYRQLSQFFKTVQADNLAQLQAKTKEETHKILSDSTEWARVMNTFVAPELKAMKLATLEDHYNAWREIGKGIEEAVNGH